MDSHNGHSPDRGNGQGADSVVGQGTSLPDTQPVDTLAAPSEPVFILRQNTMRWTANQGKVLGFFRQYGHCITNLRVIVEKLGIPYGTVRHIIRRLSGAGCIRTKPYNDASVQGIEVWYCGPGDAAPRPVMTATPPVDRAGDEQAEWTGGGQPPYMERKIERENKNLSIWNLSREQIHELWPHVCEAGLYASTLRDVKEALQRQGIENQPEKIVAQSLRFLDWQLEKGPIIDQRGNPVEKPICYWRASMMRNGYYQKPAGYTDPEEQALRQLVEEENARNAARRALREAQAEKEKQERLEELNAMLRELADRTTDHPLWTEVSAKWTSHTRREIENNPQAICNSPGIAATTRVVLRGLLGFISD